MRATVRLLPVGILSLAAAVALLLTAGCRSTSSASASGSPSSPRLPAATPLNNEREQKIYAFEHRVLPRLTHGTKGAFYDDVSTRLPPPLVELAAEVVDARFAEALGVTPSQTPPGALITFETPGTMTHCYFAFLAKSEGKHRYFTLEQTIDLSGSGAKTMFCEWAPDGRHLNHGPRAYTDAKSFLAELAQRWLTPDAVTASSPAPKSAATP